jgi:hypothetical protein
MINGILVFYFYDSEHFMRSFHVTNPSLKANLGVILGAGQSGIRVVSSFSPILI